MEETATKIDENVLRLRFPLRQLSIKMAHLLAKQLRAKQLADSFEAEISYLNNELRKKNKDILDLNRDKSNLKQQVESLLADLEQLLAELEQLKRQAVKNTELEALYMQFMTERDKMRQRYILLVHQYVVKLEELRQQTRVTEQLRDEQQQAILKANELYKHLETINKDITTIRNEYERVITETPV